MIADDSRQGKSYCRRYCRYGVVALAVVLLSGCINSKLVITPLYGRLDNQMRAQFNKLGDFNKEQKRAVEQAIGTFHVWHRKSELPRYSLWIRELADAIASNEATTAEEVEGWGVSLADHSRRARECYPIYFLVDQMQSLSDKQIDFIEQRFKEELIEDRERYSSNTPEDRIKRRIKNIDKWAGRISLDLTPAQLALIRESLAQQVSMSAKYNDLVEQWNKQLFKLARDRDNPNFSELMKTHLSKRGSLLSTTYPDQWQENRDLWQQTVRDVLTSLSPAQRKASSKWLTVFAGTLDKLSKDKPSFSAGDDTSVGCLVGSDSL